MLRSIAFLAGLAAVVLAASGCTSASCTALFIVREMPFEATVPASVDTTTSTLELCVGSVCDTARIVTSPNPNVSTPLCEDVDGRTLEFQTTCTYDPTSRKLSLKTNTADSGHPGSERLVLTAIAASGERTKLVSGTVSYEDTSDASSRGACSDAWKGTFTPEPQGS